MSILDQYGKPINPESSSWQSMAGTIARHAKEVRRQALEYNTLLERIRRDRLRRALLGDEHYRTTPQG